MKKTKTILCFCTIAIMLFCLIPTLSMNVEAAPQPARYVPGEVIIGLKDASIEEFRPFVSGLGAAVKREILGLNALVVKVTPGAEESLMRSMRGRPEVAFVERNGIINAAFIPNDTNWPLQWNMPMIKANASWDTYRGSTEVVIAIIDTGIDYNHPDLAANYKSGGYDWVNNDFNPMDDNSHGTHCAGIAAAVLNNALGVAGVAQVKVWTEKVLDNTGSGSWDDAASGIIHATDKGVNVISMSMGGYSYSNLLDNACTYASNHGVVLVAAAGNDNRDLTTYPFYPASFSTVIAVSATKSTDTFDSSYSNYGNKIEVSAPGTSIYSTVPNATYGYKTGTSMACPHVAGLVALIWSYKPQLTSGQVRSALQTSVDDKGAVGKDSYYGYGRINCQKIISSPERYQYRFQLSPFADRVWVNVTSKPGGMLINGKVNVSATSLDYPAPVLGWGSGNSFYMILDFRGIIPGSYELGFLVGTISTASGSLYRTVDGTTWVGPTAVSLVSFAETTEDSEQLNAAAEVEATAIQYVEGFNPTQTPQNNVLYTGGWYGLQYTPSVSYPLKKVEFIAGGATGPFTVQLRPDNGSGYPSNTVLRQVTFNLANTTGTWQGAEFDTAYQVSAGTTVWIVLQPVALSRFPMATSGTLYTNTYDSFANGIGWDMKETYRWMAKFYREVQPNFKYHFTVSPFIDKAYVNITSQSGGTLIYGLANVTANIVSYPAPILGWAVGNNFYMPFDYRTVIGSGAFELGFLVGTVSTASGNLYRTYDGTSVVGPTAVTLVAFAESVKEQTKPLSATP